MIVGLVAALGASLITLFATKHANKKKTAQTAEPKVAATTVSQPIETKKQTTTAQPVKATTADANNGLFSSFSNFV